MSRPADACPALDDLVNVYFDLANPDSAIDLSQVEAQLEQCLAQERQDQQDPYPSAPKNVLQTTGLPVESSTRSSVDTKSETYYIYIKRPICPYLDRARQLLEHKTTEERPFADDDFSRVMPEHAATLKAQSQPLSSPQIFHGGTFIPDGSSGLEQYLTPKSQSPVTSKPQPPAFKYTYQPPKHHSPAASKSKPQVWFVYGSERCGYCRQAMDILGDKAVFVELYTYTPTLKAKQFNQLDPKHAQLVGSNRSGLVKEIVSLRDTQGVPIIYYKDRRVPNDFDRLASYASDPSQLK